MAFSSYSLRSTASSLARKSFSEARYVFVPGNIEDVSSILKTNGITRNSEWLVMLKLHEFVNGLLNP